MQKVFEKIINKLEELRPHGIMGEYADIICEDAIKTVKEVAEKYNDGWIPVSERLPNNDKDVLMCFKYKNGVGDTDIGHYVSNENFNYWNPIRCAFGIFHKECEVIAWQPLPEHYKERE